MAEYEKKVREPTIFITVQLQKIILRLIQK